MFIDKLKLKEQIRIGKVDIKLLQTCQLFDHFRDSEALKIIALKLYNKTLNVGDILFDQEYEQRQIYIILFGQVGDFKTGDCFDYHHFRDKVTVYHQTDLIYMNKSMYDFLLEENHQKGVRQISSFISGHKMFRNLTTAQLMQFCQSLRIKVVNDNWPIVTTKELPKFGYIIVKGVLKGIKNKYPICEFKKGDAVCVYDCLFNQEMQFTIVPHQQTTLIEMDKRLLMDWVEHLIVDRQIITINEDSIKKAKEWEKFKQKTLKQIYK